jgi:hypothetical protein
VYWTLTRERRPKEKGLKWIWVTVDTPQGRAIALFSSEERAKDFTPAGDKWEIAQLDDEKALGFVDDNMFTGDAQGRPVSHVVVDPDGYGGHKSIHTLYEFATPA